MTEPELKRKTLKCEKAHAATSPAPLARAFDHCPSALFDFLTDRDAACVACALCEPRFLSSRRYEIKAWLTLHDVMAGRYPCVVRNVERREYKSEINISADWVLPSELLLTVTRLRVWAIDKYKLDLRGLLMSMPKLRCLEFSGRVSPADLPRSLTELHIQALNRPFSQLPPGLTKLEFRWSHDVPLQALNDLPASLTELTIYGKGKCGPADRDSVTLPASLTKLVISISCFAALKALPASLETLELVGDGKLFPVAIRSSTLRKLVLPENCSMPIRAADLPNLRELSVQEGFGLPLDDLPPLLTELAMHGRSKYSHDLDHLPASLTKLTLHRPCAHRLDKLPSSLLSLTLIGRQFNQPLDHLPASLTELLLDDARSFNQPLDHLPPQLQVLKLGEKFNQPLDHLPESLQVLCLGEAFNQPLDRLPSLLKELGMASGDSKFNQPLDHLPDSVTQLTVWSRVFNQPFQRLPRDLIELDLKYSDSFDHPLPLVAPEPLPDHDGSHNVDADADARRPSSRAGQEAPAGYPTALRSLRLGCRFNQPLVLPRSLTRLSIYDDGRFAQPLPLASLPAGLTELDLPKGFLRCHPEYEDKEAMQRQCPDLQL